MAYDISIMSTDADGKLSYRFSGLTNRIVGKEKMTQHYIKYLYDDNIGGLIKLFRTSKTYTERDIVSAAFTTLRYHKSLQAGKSLHADEVISNISINKIEIDRKIGRVDIEIVIKSVSGAATTINI